MAISKNIIDMMGGTIAVQTEKDKDKDKGTEFTIRLALRLYRNTAAWRRSGSWRD